MMMMMMIHDDVVAIALRREHAPPAMEVGADLMAYLIDLPIVVLVICMIRPMIDVLFVVICCMHVVSWTLILI